jgi:hypothetical protein
MHLLRLHPQHYNSGCVLMETGAHSHKLILGGILSEVQSICKSISAHRIRRLIDEGATELECTARRVAHPALASGRELRMQPARFYSIYPSADAPLNSPGKTLGVSQNHNALGPICHFDGP